MSKVSEALEAAVATVIENRPADGGRPSARQRAVTDRAFTGILKLLAPRIRFFIRRYGLGMHQEDAEQVCAIGVHRAIEAYDPEKATFTTFVNWQIRGELQGLRFRLMADQRASAKKVGATTVSLDTSFAEDGEEAASLETMIEDEDALAQTEAGASEYLAETARQKLLDDYVDHLRRLGIEEMRRKERRKRKAKLSPQERRELVKRLDAPNYGLAEAAIQELEEKVEVHRSLVERRIFEGHTLRQVGEATGMTRDRIRRVTSDAVAIMSEITEQIEEAPQAVSRAPIASARGITALAA